MPLPDLESIYSRESSDPAVMVADGSNVTVTVRGNQLAVSDGVRSTRRSRRLSRADRLVSRIVILGNFGYVTLDALRWCTEESVSICHLDRDGAITFTSPAISAQNLKIRQAQILASAGYSPITQLDILKYLTIIKLTGQAEIVRDLFKDDIRASNIRTQIEYAYKSTLESLIGYEARAAVIYWQAWQDKVTVPFSPKDMLTVPSHWLTFTGRVSEQGAKDPVNAMLNYAYKIAETEAIHACHISGLDPMIGLSHKLRDDRHSLALDIIEVVRPLCDRIVLRMLDYGHGLSYDRYDKPIYFPANWVFEIRHGVTRLFAPLTHKIAECSAEIGLSVRDTTAKIVDELAHAEVLSPHGSQAPLSSPVRVRSSFGVPRRLGHAQRRTELPVPGHVTDVIPDHAWSVISRQITGKVMASHGGGVQTIDDRAAIAAIVWCTANNLPLRRVPDVFMTSSSTLYRRRKEWRDSGEWPSIVRAITRTVLPGFTGN
jgi:CRISPR-associated endonuclease Cas1